MFVNFTSSIRVSIGNVETAVLTQPFLSQFDISVYLLFHIYLYPFTHLLLFHIYNEPVRSVFVFGRLLMWTV